MDDEAIRRIINEIDPSGTLTPEMVESLILALQERAKTPLVDGDRRGDAVFHTLEEQLKDEPDWRERARLVARSISQQFE